LVKVQDAKTRLSALLREVEGGAEITIARGSTPVARIVPVSPPAPASSTRPFGFLRYRLPESFFDELPAEEIEAWEGGS
jgi:prevent-host-death family protein